MIAPSAPIILASSSAYRRQLLERLGLPFESVSADVDESRRVDEAATDMAPRLALAKAMQVAQAHPGALVIGSDQTAECNGQILGKPGDTATACRQLHLCSGRAVQFITAVCVVDARSSALQVHSATDVTCVHFRTLDDAAIRRYVAREQPFDCAGSFKAEALGITLFERVRSDDPTALVGLPLIALCRLLRTCGLTLP